MFVSSNPPWLSSAIGSVVDVIPSPGWVSTRRRAGEELVRANLGLLVSRILAPERCQGRGGQRIDGRPTRCRERPDPACCLLVESDGLADPAPVRVGHDVLS
jgi:hypothetical protein